MTFYTVYDINVFVHFIYFFFGGVGTSKSMPFYTVYEINVLSTVFPGYVKVDDVLYCK